MSEWFSGPRPGWRVGPDHSPDEYTLVEAVTRGGEGDVWLARRIQPDGRQRGGDWAVKMLLTGHPAVTRHGDDPETLLRTWNDRWYKSHLDSSDLHAVPGVVVPAQIFGGPAPHPPGEAPLDPAGAAPGGERGLYMATRWVEGTDLRRWREAAAPRDLPNVVTEVCRIVDALHDLGRVHGDISPGNIMVGPDGRVSLIDFTFMRFTELSRTTAAITRGFGAPEAAEESTERTDAYSVGAVVYHLLTGQQVPTAASGLPARDAARVAERVLDRHGWSREVADLVTAALSPDPARRPVPLRPWGHRLGALLAAEASQVTCVDVVSDVRDGRITVTGSLLGLAASGPWRPPPDGPRAVARTAAVLDGTGRLVVLALDPQDGLWAAFDGRWQRVTERPVHGRPAVARACDGGVVCVALGPEQVLAFDLSPGETGFRERVLKEGLRTDSAVGPAITRPDGPLVVLYREGPELFAITDGLVEPVLAELRPKAAALGISQWGDVEVLAVDGTTGTLVAVEQLSGGWAPPMTVPCPVPIDDLAVLDHREGRTIAVAGPQGVWVMTTGGPWEPLDARPAERVVLRPTRSWQMQLAALAGGQATCWAEDHTKRWVPQD
ncbi:protein kinase [Actinomadura sp. NAK00032]|uniref:serine/threonine protein kinase n=1 Tax=Actinomadura sp. NAK00032 TaxID=2742128 RepID=UPI00158FAD01|nr:protein kinase [Actinomadura sp. NAK00032]QKW33313.1 protein kinase [Actinomadura sp. NAK00032]